MLPDRNEVAVFSIFMLLFHLKLWVIHIILLDARLTLLVLASYHSCEVLGSAPGVFTLMQELRGYYSASRIESSGKSMRHLVYEDVIIDLWWWFCIVLCSPCVLKLVIPAGANKSSTPLELSCKAVELNYVDKLALSSVEVECLFIRFLI